MQGSDLKAGWPAIFLKKIKYNSRIIQVFLKHIFGPQFWRTPQNIMIDKHI